MTWSDRPAVFMYAAMLLAAPAHAGEPAAIVEDIAAAGTGLRIMDYVEPGRVVRLKEGEWITLGYLQSCLEERIVGATIRIGLRSSDVEGGSVIRRKVECAGGSLNLSPEQTDKSAGLVFRKPPARFERRKNSSSPDIVLPSRSPVIRLKRSGQTITIERLDRKEPTIQLEVPGIYVDLASRQITMTPGGTYRVSTTRSRAEFRVDASAPEEAGPIIGRLIRLGE